MGTSQVGFATTILGLCHINSYDFIKPIPADVAPKAQGCFGTSCEAISDKPARVFLRSSSRSDNLTYCSSGLPAFNVRERFTANAQRAISPQGIFGPRLFLTRWRGLNLASPGRIRDFSNKNTHSTSRKTLVIEDHPLPGVGNHYSSGILETQSLEPRYFVKIRSSNKYSIAHFFTFFNYMWWNMVEKSFIIGLKCAIMVVLLTVTSEAMTRAPSTKMKRTAQILIENPDDSLSSAMRAAGYSEAHSKNPHKLKRSRTWQELMDAYLPEDKIANLIAEQLQATNVYILNGEVKEKPDNQARLKAAEMILRLRSKYAHEKDSGNAFYIPLSELRKMRDSGEI